MIPEDVKLLVSAAHDYAVLANTIVGFFIARTLLFQLSFSKDEALVAALLRWRPYSTFGAIFTPIAYAVPVGVCYYLEQGALAAAGRSEMLLTLSAGGLPMFLLRLAGIACVSLSYLRVFIEVCREEEFLNDRNPSRVKIPRLGNSAPRWMNRIDKFVFGTLPKELLVP
jgi:hypothetical protein